jgi:hypothetical protein
VFSAFTSSRCNWSEWPSAAEREREKKREKRKEKKEKRRKEGKGNGTRKCNYSGNGSSRRTSVAPIGGRSASGTSYPPVEVERRGNPLNHPNEGAKRRGERLQLCEKGAKSRVAVTYPISALEREESRHQACPAITRSKYN